MELIFFLLLILRIYLLKLRYFAETFLVSFCCFRFTTTFALETGKILCFVAFFSVLQNFCLLDLLILLIKPLPAQRNKLGTLVLLLVGLRFHWTFSSVSTSPGSPQTKNATLVVFLAFLTQSISPPILSRND